MFIVKKKIHGKDYFYLRESKRVDGKVKSVDLGYLGKTREEAEEKLKQRLKKESSQNIKMEKEIFHEKISADELAMFCKKKGFIYPSAEIYGGFAGFWDFGNLGVELNNNIKKEWWKFHVLKRQDVVGIDGSIITNPKVWEASGHVERFLDIAVVNKKTKEKFKVDKFELKKYENNPDYEIKGEFNPMFSTNVGPIAKDAIKAYLRPETAQSIFINFKVVQESARMKLAFGIAQIGKSFRNEIAPRNFLFRSREFEQMEIEYFIKPGQKCPYEIPDEEILVYSAETQAKKQEPVKMKIRDAFKKGIIKKEWHAYWLALEFSWFKNLGANPDNFRIRQHLEQEKSHYAVDTWDLEYNFPFGWKELEGIADRGNFDLSQHEKFSKKDLHIFDEETKKKILPEVICEPSLGVGRALMVFMFDAYYKDKEKENIILKLSPKLAPIKAAVFPIVKRVEFEEIAMQVLKDLGEEWNVVYDKSGSIGRRYARNDEVGTPFCITIDEESLKKKDVTIRERDTAKQIRVKLSELKNALRDLINEKIKFEDAGKLVK